MGSDDWVLALVAGRVRETSGEPSGGVDTHEQYKETRHIFGLNMHIIKRDNRLKCHSSTVMRIQWFSDFNI